MFARCAKGCQIPSGDFALFVRAGYLKSIWCQTCAEQQYGLTPPIEPFEAGAEDARTRSTGD